MATRKQLRREHVETRSNGDEKAMETSKQWRRESIGENKTMDLNDEQFQLVLDMIQSIGYSYRQDFAKRYPNPLVHGPGPVYKNLLPDWNKFQY